jgi:TetR/AcrR family transcriptional repressor of nem operon
MKENVAHSETWGVALIVIAPALEGACDHLQDDRSIFGIVQPMVTEQCSAKHHILDCGERLIATKGFVGVGLSEILSTANVPKGSFYHYFSSKERFGEELLTRYMNGYLTRLDTLLSDEGTSARVRLMRYWALWNIQQCGIAPDGSAVDASPKCLIVKLSAEVADISEAMRLTLRDGTDRVVQRIAQCLDEARADGSVAATLVASDTALTLYALWLGASLLAKLRRDSSAFEHALRSTDALLGPPA